MPHRRLHYVASTVRDGGGRSRLDHGLAIANQGRQQIRRQRYHPCCVTLEQMPILGPARPRFTALKAFSPQYPREKTISMSNGFRSRMVSFRMTEEEYERLRQLCDALGIRSVSDLARAGINLLLQQPDRATPETLESRVTEIESRLRILSLEMRRIKQGDRTTIGSSSQQAAECALPE